MKLRICLLVFCGLVPLIAEAAIWRTWCSTLQGPAWAKVFTEYCHAGNNDPSIDYQIVNAIRLACCESWPGFDGNNVCNGPGPWYTITQNNYLSIQHVGNVTVCPQFFNAYWFPRAWIDMKYEQDFFIDGPTGYRGGLYCTA